MENKRNKMYEFVAVAGVGHEGEEQREVIIKHCKDCHHPAFHNDVSAVALPKWSLASAGQISKMGVVHPCLIKDLDLEVAL